MSNPGIAGALLAAPVRDTLKTASGWPLRERSRNRPWIDGLLLARLYAASLPAR
jgi:hypothetical protein